MRPRAVDEFLKKARIPFTGFQHPPGFTAQHNAALSHVSGRSWAKTIVCVADEETILVVLPAHLRVNLEQLRLLVTAATLRLACEEEMTNLWADCEVGATVPFLTRWDLRVFVDRTLVGEPEMVFSAGTHTDAIRLHYSDFAELTRPIVGSFGEPLRGNFKSAARL